MSRKKILIADDDPRLLKALALRLESDFDVSTCQDSYQALQSARRSKPDVLVLDINMPGGDGFSVHERLKNIEGVFDTPVIFITGEKSGRVDLQSHKLGAFGVVHKPFESQALIDMIWAAADSGFRIADSA